jgi:hypothetical protein
MRHPFAASASLVVTAVVSFLLSNILPWSWTFTGFDKHHWYGYTLQADLGILVPTVAVILAGFFLLYGILTRGIRADDDLPRYDR